MVKIRHLGRVLLGLVTLFVLSGTTASAQITDLSSLSSSKSYTLVASRAYLRVSTNGAAIYGTSGTVDATVANNTFAIIVSPNHSGEYYLYNVGASKFVSATTAASGEGYWTCSLSSTPTDRVKINATSNSSYPWYFTNASSGQFLNIGGSNQPIFDGWSTLDAGNQFAITEAADLAEDVQTSINTAIAAFESPSATVTYNYYIGSEDDANLYTTSTGTVKTGAAVTAPANPAFATVESYTIKQGETTLSTTDVVSSTDAITVSVICQESLPFNVSTDAQKYYYVMGIHSNDTGSFGSGYTYAQGEATWVISYDGSSLAKSQQPYSQNVSTFSDDYLWYVTGDLLNGFKLYNKNSGTNFLVKTSTGNSACTFGSDETYGNFKMYASTAISGDYCFKLDDDTYYINKNGDGVLQGWTDTDGGSSFHFLAVSSFPQAYYTSVITTCNNDIPDSSVPTNACGIRTTPAIDYSAATTAYNASTAAPFDDDATADLVSANTTAKGTIDAIAYNAVPSDYTSGYYRLFNYKEHKYLTYNGDYMNDQESGTSVGSVFKFAATSTDGQYYMNVEGINIGQFYASHASSLSSDATAAEVTLSQTSGIYKIQDVSTASGTDASCRYLHVNSGNATGWYASSISNNPPSFWYLVPADIAEVSLNTVGKASYATTCLPFGVSSVSGATAYIGAYNADETEINATATTDGTIPANTGVILVGAQDATTATLTIGTATAVSGNVLAGTCVAITNDSYLTFGRLTSEGESATEPGFYYYTGTTIPANKAYLVKAAAETVRLNFGDATTGIDAATLVNGEQNNAPVYDLSGRRVATPVKGGIYLQGGKKFIK